MKDRTLSFPQLGLIALTRVALGMGIGLLLSQKFDERERRGAGWALFTVGALTSIPLIASVLHAPSSEERLAA